MDSSRTRSVLVVNDDGEHDKFLSVLLEQSGFATTTAIDGVDGLEKARQHVPDVVVCDVMMPRRDGFGLCRALRADEGLREPPVLLVTALLNLAINARDAMPAGGVLTIKTSGAQGPPSWAGGPWR